MKEKQPVEINLEAIEINELSVFLEEGAGTFLNLLHHARRARPAIRTLR
jgi:hypothetical protein